MARFDVTGFEWLAIQPLHLQKLPGVPSVNDRRVLNGTLWRMHNGSALGRYSSRTGLHTTRRETALAAIA